MSRASNSELGYFKSVSQVLTLNISALKEQVLRLAINSLDWIN